MSLSIGRQYDMMGTVDRTSIYRRKYGCMKRAYDAIVPKVERAEVGHIGADACQGHQWRRRLLLSRVVLGGLSTAFYGILGDAEAEEDFTLYASDRMPMYSLEYPSTWDVTTKAGADVLFKGGKGVQLGVTILPVRIASVKEYGSLDGVADKIIQAEKAKDGNISAKIIRQAENGLEHGNAAYDYAYEVETTRGTKRIVSRVCIVNKELYIVNGMISCGKSGPCAQEEIDLKEKYMERAVHSFTVHI